MIFLENRLLFSRNIIPYFCRKLGKMSQNLSSAAGVIGALTVKKDLVNLSPAIVMIGVLGNIQDSIRL